MTEIKMEDLVEQDTTSASEQVETTVETEQDPLIAELDKVQNFRPRPVRTEAEKATFSLKKNAERVKELGLNPEEILGIKSNSHSEEDIDDEDRPLTVKEYKLMQQEQATKTASDLADAIPGQVERELVKFHIKNTIKSTGNPAEDLRLARMLANGAKNASIVEEVTRKPQAKNFSNATSANAIETPVEQELSKEEMQFMKPPFNLSKEQIIKARKG